MSTQKPLNGLSTEQQNQLRIKAVWVKLGEMFGTTFENQFGTEPNETWVQAISEIQEYELMRGFQALENSGREYPPSLALFVKLCKSIPDRSRKKVTQTPSDVDPLNDLTFIPKARLVLLRLATFHVKHEQMNYSESLDLGKRMRNIGMPEAVRIAKDFEKMIDVDKIPVSVLQPDFVKAIEDQVWPLIV